VLWEVDERRVLAFGDSEWAVVGLEDMMHIEVGMEPSVNGD